MKTLNSTAKISPGASPNSLPTKKKSLFKRLYAQKELQLMVLFGLVFVFIFRFLPAYGLQLAFKELIPGRSIGDSPWVGLKHFQDFFSSGYAGIVFYNTFVLSFLRILFGFPLPIIFALLLNEIASKRARSLVQGISYLPHFMSWVICSSVLFTIFAGNGGTINFVLMKLGIIHQQINWFSEPKYFWPLLIITDNWKEVGWGAIIYVAAIAGIPNDIYESASLDGAGKLKQALYITIPCIMPTVVIMLVLRLGNILDAGFDQILILRNSAIGSASYILDVYVYDTGIQAARYGYATAVGLFKSVVGFVFIWLSNSFAKKYDMGIW
jgi:putative aldouronate transport system permease protein